MTIHKNSPYMFTRELTTINVTKNIDTRSHIIFILNILLPVSLIDIYHYIYLYLYIYI